MYNCLLDEEMCGCRTDVNEGEITTWALLLAVRSGLLLLEIPFISSCSLVMLLVNMPKVSMILALSSAFIALFFSSLDIRSCRAEKQRILSFVYAASNRVLE